VLNLYCSILIQREVDRNASTIDATNYQENRYRQITLDAFSITKIMINYMVF
jgi:hypothetical protein